MNAPANAAAGRPHQRGAALAIALLVLVIIALIGIAAVRAAKMELRLARNAESRMAAMQAADSMVALVSDSNNLDTYLPANNNFNFTACVKPAAVTGTAFTACNNDAVAITPSAVPLLNAHGYALIRREGSAERPFVEVNVLREAGLSAKNYDFARFSVTGGYDRSADGLSAALVTVGTLRLHAKVTGVNYE